MTDENNIKVSYDSPWNQYYCFSDGDTFMRKGIRVVDSEQIFGVDIAISEDGFAGVEDTDFEMIYGIIL